jgi:hypothetical protein
MHPRTIAILIAAILLAAFGLRFLVFHFELLPVTEVALLKKATAVTVTYTVWDRKDRQGQFLPTSKSLTISKTEEVEDLLAALQLRPSRFRDDRRRREQELVFRGIPVVAAPTVAFHFPDGTSRGGMTFEAQDWLGHMGIEREFYLKMCDLVSRAEGKRVEVLGNGPPQNEQP